MGKESLAPEGGGRERRGAGQSRKGEEARETGSSKCFWGGKLTWNSLGCKKDKEQMWGDLENREEDMRMEEPRRNRGP